MERKLPVYELDGTPFIVDVAKGELHERDNAENRIAILDLPDEGEGYLLRYNKVSKKQAIIWDDEDDVIEIILPQMVTLDKEGMAAKHSVPLDRISGLSDYDVIVNQEALRDRVKGILPTIDIMGRTFYVDMQMGCIRPKDDFSTTGISFEEIIDFEEDTGYLIPYNPKTLSIDRTDPDGILEIPKDFFVVQIPFEYDLDPVGFTRKNGMDTDAYLKRHPPRKHFEARVLDWEKETLIMDIISRNRERLNQQRPAHATRKGKRL